MILWLPVPQDRALATLAERNVTALVSPEHRGFVTALLPSMSFPTHLDVGADFAGINTQVDSTGGRIVVMMVGQRGRARALLRWNLPPSQQDDARRVSSDDDVASMVDALTDLFGSAVGGPRDPGGAGGAGQAGDVGGAGPAAESVGASVGGGDAGVEALREALSRRHHGQASIVDAVARVIDLPELRERVDQRIAVGHSGPSVEYPARLLGPTDVMPFTARTVAARSRSPDPLDRVSFAPRWSGAIDPRFAVVEVAFCGKERLLKLFQSDAPVAAAVWNERWRLTPGPPEALADIFLEEVSRFMPWRWDRRAMRDLLRERDHPDPLGQFGRITGVPTLEPLYASDDWSTIAPTARVIPRTTGPKLAYFRMRAAIGLRMGRGGWAPINVTNLDRPQAAEGMTDP